MSSVPTRTRVDMARLEQERSEIIESLESLRAELLNMAEPTADEADVDAFERDKTWALIQTLQHRLEAVEHAIELAKAGTYGICQNCGGTIDPARLEILPQATLCLRCQREFERRNRARA